MVRKSVVVAIAAITATIAFAASAPAQNNRQLLPGHVAKENITKVNSEIHWNTSLNSSLEQARQSHKMVLWLHMIGKMDGAT
jgi:hypothetical protein